MAIVLGVDPNGLAIARYLSLIYYAFYLIFDYFDFDLFSALLFYTRINSELTYDDICYDSYYHNDF